MTQRKLSVMVQLSDPETYTGGEFRMHHTASTPPAEAVARQGSLLVFPSLVRHEVTPVTQGIAVFARRLVPRRTRGNNREIPGHLGLPATEPSNAIPGVYIRATHVPRIVEMKTLTCAAIAMTLLALATSAKAQSPAAPGPILDILHHGGRTLRRAPSTAHRSWSTSPCWSSSRPTPPPSRPA